MKLWTYGKKCIKKYKQIDYDLRLLYMSKEQPWKWANIEMDEYQKTNDYVKIFEYIKKYYAELDDLKYLEERMIIYSILNDIRQLAKFKNLELKERILKKFAISIK